MSNELSAYASGRNFGYMLGGFLIPAVAGYFFLWLANSPKRSKGTAALFRLIAVLVAALLAFAGFVGGGGQVNYGGLAGVVLVVIVALKHQLSRRAA